MKKFKKMAIMSLQVGCLLSPLASAEIAINTAIDTTTNKFQLSESANKLRQQLSLYQQFSANFTQQVTDKKGRNIQQADGWMKMQQPNKFRWVTNEPDESIVVSDGKSVWVYNPFIEQVTAMSLNNTMTQSPLWLIANQSDQAWSDFNVEEITPLQSNVSTHSYAVTPKNKQALTKKITMHFSAKTIERLAIEDAQGQISTFTFSAFDAVSNINTNQFEFKVPAEADFDDQREIR